MPCKNLFLDQWLLKIIFVALSNNFFLSIIDREPVSPMSSRQLLDRIGAGEMNRHHRIGDFGRRGTAYFLPVVLNNSKEMPRRGFPRSVPIHATRSDTEDVSPWDRVSRYIIWSLDRPQLPFSPTRILSLEHNLIIRSPVRIAVYGVSQGNAPGHNASDRW